MKQPLTFANAAKLIGVKIEDINPMYTAHDQMLKSILKEQDILFETALRTKAIPVIKGEITPGKIRWRGIKLVERHTCDGTVIRYLEQRGKPISQYLEIKHVIQPLHDIFRNSKHI